MFSPIFVLEKTDKSVYNVIMSIGKMMRILVGYVKVYLISTINMMWMM